MLGTLSKTYFSYKLLQVKLFDRRKNVFWMCQKIEKGFHFIHCISEQRKLVGQNWVFFGGNFFSNGCFLLLWHFWAYMESFHLPILNSKCHTWNMSPNLKKISVRYIGHWEIRVATVSKKWVSAVKYVSKIMWNNFFYYWLWNLFLPYEICFYKNLFN